MSNHSKIQCENKFKSNKIKLKHNKFTEIQNAIINLMKDSPSITQVTLARLLDVNIRTIQRNIKILINKGVIRRIGTTKRGEWIVQ